MGGNQKLLLGGKELLIERAKMGHFIVIKKDVVLVKTLRMSCFLVCAKKERFRSPVGYSSQEFVWLFSWKKIKFQIYPFIHELCCLFTYIYTSVCILGRIRTKFANQKLTLFPKMNQISREVYSTFFSRDLTWWGSAVAWWLSCYLRDQGSIRREK